MSRNLYKNALIQKLNHNFTGTAMSRIIIFTLIAVLASSGLLIVESVSAQTLKPIVTDFRLQYVDNSYDVPPSYKYTKDLYTGETITTTIPGYRVENKSLVATIKNPIGVDAYNFRWKPHDDSCWYYRPFNTEADKTPPLSTSGSSGPPPYASSSEYTVLSVISLNHISNPSLDVQVQALYGEYRAVHNSPIQIEGDYYDYYFDGQASYWSHTETIDLTNTQSYVTPSPAPTTQPTPTATPTPTESPTVKPSQPDTQGSVLPSLDWMQIAVLILACIVAALTVGMVLLWRRIPR